MSTTTIGELASMAGTTVRTLHHYDQIGLLTPAARASNGYRSYGDEDVYKLQQILAYRELDLSLDEIALVLDEAADSQETLHEARNRVAMRIERLTRISESLDLAIISHTKGSEMTQEDKQDMFGGFEPQQFEAEAQQQWGETAEYQMSAQKTSTYTTKDWEKLNSELDVIYKEFLGLVADGTPTDSNKAAALVDRHRDHISTWFYECAPEVHASLGSMYTADDRFRKNIDTHGTGLADYMSEAIASRYTA